MDAFIAIVGGSGSGAGKTRFACSLLARLKGWGAIKVTPVELFSSVIDDVETLGEGGKDTQRFIHAGAAGVVWVKSTREDMAETVTMAVERLSRLDGIIVEGNSAIEVLKPDIVIFISKGAEYKESAFSVLGCADLVIYEGNLPEGAPARAEKFRTDEINGCLDSVMRVINERKDRRRT